MQNRFFEGSEEKLIESQGPEAGEGAENSSVSAINGLDVFTDLMKNKAFNTDFKTDLGEIILSYAYENRESNELESRLYQDNYPSCLLCIREYSYPTVSCIPLAVFACCATMNPSIILSSISNVAVFSTLGLPQNDNSNRNIVACSTLDDNSICHALKYQADYCCTTSLMTRTLLCEWGPLYRAECIPLMNYCLDLCLPECINKSNEKCFSNRNQLEISLPRLNVIQNRMLFAPLRERMEQEQENMNTLVKENKY